MFKPSENLIQRILKRAVKNIQEQNWDPALWKNPKGQQALKAIEDAINHEIPVIQPNENGNLDMGKTIDNMYRDYLVDQCRHAVCTAMVLEMQPDGVPERIYRRQYRPQDTVRQWLKQGEGYNRTLYQENVRQMLKQTAERDDWKTIIICMRITNETLRQSLEEARGFLRRGDHDWEDPIITACINKGINNVLVYNLTEKDGTEFGILRIAANWLVAKQKKQEMLPWQDPNDEEILKSWRTLNVLEAINPTGMEAGLGYLERAEQDPSLPQVLYEAKRHILSAMTKMVIPEETEEMEEECQQA